MKTLETALLPGALALLLVPTATGQIPTKLRSRRASSINNNKMIGIKQRQLEHVSHSNEDHPLKSNDMVQHSIFADLMDDLEEAGMSMSLPQEEIIEEATFDLSMSLPSSEPVSLHGGCII